MDPFAFFEQIYCINLDCRPERWQAVCREFDAVGILHRVQRFSGIEHEHPRRGCALSHMACIEKARRSGCRNVLIFEDDLRWRRWDEELFERAVGILKRDNRWELFYLGGRLKRQARVISPEVLESRLWGGHAYAVSHRAYARMVDVELPLDVWYSHTFCSYCIRPLMAVQAKGFSDIKGSHIENKEDIFDKYYQENTRYVEGQLSTDPLRRLKARVGMRIARLQAFLRSLPAGQTTYK